MRKVVDYAIADIHGRADLLLPLVSACLTDAVAFGAVPRFVFLGDVIDRGHSSRECLDIVMEVLLSYEGSVCIKGNHEDLATAALLSSDPKGDAVERWFSNGGGETVASYHRDWDIGFDIMRAFHGDHLGLMEGAPTSVVRHGFLLAHAGVDPDRPIDDQFDHDLMWSGSEFLNHVGYLDRIVIHGHSIVGDRPVVTENRVSIDTGAYRSGRLTACAMDGSELRFMQTDGSDRTVRPVEPFRLDRGLGTCLDHPSALAA